MYLLFKLVGRIALWTIPMAIVLLSIVFSAASDNTYINALSENNAYSRISNELTQQSQEKNLQMFGIGRLFKFAASEDLATESAVKDVLDTNIKEFTSWLRGDQLEYKLYLPLESIERSLNNKVGREVSARFCTNAEIERIRTEGYRLERDSCIPPINQLGSGQIPLVFTQSIFNLRNSFVLVYNNIQYILFACGLLFILYIILSLVAGVRPLKSFIVLLGNIGISTVILSGLVFIVLAGGSLINSFVQNRLLFGFGNDSLYTTLNLVIVSIVSRLLLPALLFAAICLLGRILYVPFQSSARHISRNTHKTHNPLLNQTFDAAFLKSLNDSDSASKNTLPHSSTDESQNIKFKPVTHSTLPDNQNPIIIVNPSTHQKPGVKSTLKRMFISKSSDGYITSRSAPKPIIHTKPIDNSRRMRGF